MSTFDKVFTLGIGLVVALVLAFGLQGMRELNDGRVSTVVSQMIRGH